MKLWQKIMKSMFNLAGYEVKFSARYSPDFPRRTVIEFWKDEKSKGNSG